MDESRILISSLCNGLWEKSWINDINPIHLLKVAEKNKILSSFAWFVFQKGYEKHFMGTEAYSLLKEALLINDRDQKVSKKKLSELLPRFKEEEIPILLLKGLSLTGTIPRDMGDMDLLIKPEDLKRSISILETAGFRYTGGERGYHKRKGEAGNWDRLLPWSNQFEFLHDKSGLLIELHIDFFHRYRLYRFNLDPLLDRINLFWERAAFSQDLGCQTLSVEDRLLLLSIHNSIKRTAVRKNFAFRNIIDIKNILDIEKVNWDRLLESAIETETLVFLIYSLEMFEMFFPGIIPASLIKKGNVKLSGRKRLLKSLMHHCYVDLDTSNHFYMILSDFWLPFAMRSRLRHKVSSLCILPVIFPDPHRLRIVYGLPKGSPLVVITYFLEPFRWLKYLLKKGMKSIGRI